MSLTSGPNLGLLENGALGEQHFAELLRLWRGIDGLVQPTVKSATTATPPSSPSNGDRYLIPASATGVWNRRTGQLARWSTMLATAGWEFYVPRKGWEVRVEDLTDTNGVPVALIYTGAAWAVPAVAPLTKLVAPDTGAIAVNAGATGILSQVGRTIGPATPYDISYVFYATWKPSVDGYTAFRIDNPPSGFSLKMINGGVIDVDSGVPYISGMYSAQGLMHFSPPAGRTTMITIFATYVKN